MGQYLNVRNRACYSGTSVRCDINELKTGIQIVFGTPRRLCRLIESGSLSLKTLKLFIMDEADELLSRGFEKHIYEIFNYIPSQTQIALFCATTTNKVSEIGKKFMINPVKIYDKTLDGIKQFYVAVEKEDYKLATLFDLYESLTITKVIIYCNTQTKVMWLANKMKEHDFTVSAMCGDRTERELIMTEFHDGNSRILITTDLMGKGVDSQSLAINYDIPIFPEYYVYRIGRSGKFGRHCVAINFVSDDEEEKLRAIQIFYNTQINELPMDIDSII